MTTALEVFEAAIAMMDELNDQGQADHSDTTEYKNRTLPILNILRGELYPYSDTYMIQDSGRPIAAQITDFEVPIELDDYICQSVMPYGLAAHLLMDENPTSANYFQQRYDELKNGLRSGYPSNGSEDIVDVYGGRGGINPYNEFSLWS
jgi:hypothetical protein